MVDYLELPTLDSGHLVIYVHMSSVYINKISMAINSPYLSRAMDIL